MQKPPGSICSSGLGPDFVDRGTLALGKAPAPATAGGEGFGPEEFEVLLDLTQLVLDLAGIIDPTPISDGSSAVISMGRGDWLGAGLSGLALIPYVGDLAKVGKLGRWATTVEKAVALVKRNARFAERARPILRRLAEILDQIPDRLVPDSARATLARIKENLKSVLGAQHRSVKVLMVNQYLQRWFKYIDELPIVPPPPGRAAFWSKLDGAQQNAEGADLAARLAVLEGKVTLEMTLESSKFVEHYKLAEAQLLEQLGSQAKDLWPEFGRKVWERVSEKYAAMLEGTVTVYGRVVTGGAAPILGNELDVVSDIMLANSRIPSVEFVDVVTGVRKRMDRAQVLSSAQRTH
jgi:hypothetical protein